MSVLDRLNRERRKTATPLELTAGVSERESPSSILVVRESPVIVRLKSVLGMLQNFIETNDTGTDLARWSFLMTAMTDELTDELDGKDDEIMAAFMAQIGLVISWIGHGDNDKLPEFLKDFAESVQPSESLPA